MPGGPIKEDVAGLPVIHRSGVNTATSSCAGPGSDETSMARPWTTSVLPVRTKPEVPS